MPDKISWPIVTLVAVVMAAFVTMAALHAPTQALTDVLILLGVGGGLGLANATRHNVNGNLSKLVDLIASAMERLAQSNPPAPPTPVDEEPPAVKVSP